MTDQELVRLAQETLERAYAPYSGFRVAAVLETSSGAVFTGVNVENASYGLSCCAERSAVFAAVAAGERALEKMAIVSDQRTPVRPCGACLQVLWEFGPDLVLLLAAPGGVVERRRVRDLLPEGFVFPKRPEG